MLYEIYKLCIPYKGNTAENIADFIGLYMGGPGLAHIADDSEYYKYIGDFVKEWPMDNDNIYGVAVFEEGFGDLIALTYINKESNTMRNFL